MAPAVILFGHGSRDPAWREAMESVAARALQIAPDGIVRCAFLEHDQPSLQAAVADAVAQGAGAVCIVPMFLGAGRHVREDLPRLVDALRQVHAGVRIDLQQSVGENPRVVDILARVAISGT